MNILIPNTQYALASKELLDEAVIDGSIIICDMVYAELSSQFQSQKVLENFLRETGIRVEIIGREVLYRAGMAWKEYSKIREKKLRCPECGNKIEPIHCNKCNREYLSASIL